ncbi:SDR family NAD(P)-dependent oxidoreductase [Pedobacter sp. WC2423]|uniref:SDR family NAD(P)-dependent oxidoreductase n=1 Tax=Pedobacter sp. WC2423 TaxID=3234142 RepID=UPI003465FEFB
MTIKNSKVWLVTGVSTGLGREIAKVAAENGNIVIGTLRNENQFSEFYDLVPGKTHPIKMDVTKSSDITAGINQIISEYGQIDVLVNNAGFGLIGAAEEFSEEEARQQFDTNFWGAFNTTTSVLPQMKLQKQGKIIQITAIGGFAPFPGMSVYGASKSAVEAFSASLALEVAGFGIGVMSVLPGPMRTNFAGGSLKSPAKVLPEYEESVGGFKDFLASINGKQPWSPYKTAQVIYEASQSDNAPTRLFIGDLAVEGAGKVIATLSSDLSNWKKQALSTKFDDAPLTTH